MSRSAEAKRKRTIRMLKYCISAPRELKSPVAENAQNVLIDRVDAKPLRVNKSEIDQLVRDDLVRNTGSKWSITETGKMHLRRLLSEVDEFQSQHRIDAYKSVSDGKKQHLQKFNLAESPLARLHHRKCSKGNSYISAEYFQAGERLRSDFSLGQLMRSVTSNWRDGMSGGERSGGTGGIADLTDAAIAARIRTEKALAAIGPEFSGPLVDICCFLKGLELVERERLRTPVQ